MSVLTPQSEGGVSMRQMRVWLPNLSPSTRIVVEGLLPTKALGNLRAFSFACSFNQPGIVKGLQQRLGPSLRVLELMCDNVFASGECTLSHCTGLQHIRILGTRPIGSPSTFRNTFGVLSQMTNVPTFISRVRAPNVVSVHFVHLPRWITKDYGSWVGQSLAALSANSALSRTVRKVAFEIYGQEFKERDEDSEAEQRRRIREVCYGSPEFIRDAWAQH
ncbi:hypothetical protein K466DRAFT_604082 [Polyporus arcularius HHB13444]|uniref:Uncharacterized protein n=1 Tax=Polyporus arcularius HHB13444 TaxID=1314778 RepID=A0A5C3NYR9_9APHY|nr:hypothetical protein K466DRAFT_604082 [Polyporus arcularius HHB13444]